MRKLLRRLWYLLRRARLEADLWEEMETHRAIRRAQLEQDGVSAAEADRASRIMLGSVAVARDDVRDMWSGWTDAWSQDLRHGLRALASRPGFAVTAVLTLILAIGANLVVFTLVNALWLRPRPISDPDRVVMILGESGSGTYDTMYWAPFGLERIADQPAFEIVGGQVPTSGEMSGNLTHVTLEGTNGEIETIAVTREYFSIMGLRIQGRDFGPDDDRPGAEIVGILSQRLWRAAFRGSPDVFGTVIRTGPAAVRVIGIAPEGFHGARLGERADLWVSRYAVSRLASPGMGQPDPNLLGLARLRAGVSPDAAERVVAQEKKGLGRVRVIPVSRLYGSPLGASILVDQQSVIWVAAGMAALVLLAGCATLMGIVLVHYERRRAELAIRLALGCSRARLVRALGVELGALVTVGSVGALAAAWAGIRVLPALSLPGGLDLGRLDLSPDWRVAAFSGLAAVATVMVAAVPPLRRATRPGLVTDLVSSSSRTTPSSLRLRRAILAAHVAAAVIVLVAAGLFVRTVMYGSTIGPGFDTARTLFVELMMRSPSGPAQTKAQAAERNARDAGRVSQLLNNLRGVPGIQDVALGPPPIRLTQVQSAETAQVVRSDTRERNIRLSYLDVGANYPAVLGLKRLAGRDLTNADALAWGAPGNHAVLVTRSLASGMWPGESAVGRVFVLHGRYTFVVVGVVEDLAFGSLRFSQHSGVLAPTDVNLSARFFHTSLAVRTTVDATTLVEPIRKAVTEVFPNSPRVDVVTGRDIVSRDLGRERLGAWFFSGFGLIALVLGVSGVFGLVAYLAASRRREMGVRLALGALPSQVSRLVVLAGLGPVIVGTAAGLGAAALLTGAVDALLIGVGRFDLLTYSAVALVMLASTAAAGLIAAWRLRQLAPTEVLRAE